MLPATQSLAADGLTAVGWLVACAMALDGKAVADSLPLPLGPRSACITAMHNYGLLSMSKKVTTTDTEMIQR